MPKLSDTQSVILSTASQRDSGSLVPLPASLADRTGARTAIKKLIAHGLADERETADRTIAYRDEGDVHHGVFVTSAGLAAIGVSEEPTAGGGQAGPTVPVTAALLGKSAMMVELMRRTDGATMAELTAATGWLPHSTRAALTGLRKKGVGIDRGKRGVETCYRIAG